MNEKKKPGCLWRLVKFTLFTLVILAVAGYFLCWYVPTFKLTPERIGWTLPEGVEVPLTEDGKFVDHEKAFELTYPEFYAHPHKNGWRRVLLAVSPAYFRQKAESYAALYTRHTGTEATPEDWKKWEAGWAACYRKLDILPEEIGDFMPGGQMAAVEKAICRDFFREVQAFAADFPELQVTDEALEDMQDMAFWEALERAGTRKHELYAIRNAHSYLIWIDPEHFPEEFEKFADLRVPFHLISDYPGAVEHELQSVAWRAEDYPELSAWIASQSAFWDTVAEAVREEIFYPLPVGSGNPDATLLREVARGLKMRAAMRHGSGDTAGAMKDVETIILMGRQLQRAPMPVAYLIGEATEGDGWWTIIRHLEAGLYSREDLAFIGDLMENGRVTRQWMEFLPEMKWQYYRMAERPQWGPDMYQALPALRDVFPVEEWRLSLMRRVAKMPMNPNRVTDAAVAVFREIEAAKSVDFLVAERETHRQMELPQWVAYMVFTRNRTQAFISAMRDSLADLPTITAERQYHHERDALLRAGIACQRYRLDKGEFPASLEALVPEYLAEVPEQPFLPGQKVKYRVEDDRVVIYAAGYDGRDDGGLWNLDWDREQYERMKGTDEEEYRDKCDTILRLKK